MRIKETNKVSNWLFNLIDPAGNQVVVPPYGFAPNIYTLRVAVLQWINTYDEATNGEYSKEQRRLAQESGVSFENHIDKLIHHQMCLNNRGVVPCWNEGPGDVIHNALTAVDGFIEKTPEPVRRFMDKSIAKMTPSRSKTLGGCSACGGSRVMDPNSNNLGRAGKLNNFFRRNPKP